MILRIIIFRKELYNRIIKINWSQFENKYQSDCDCKQNMGPYRYRELAPTNKTKRITLLKGQRTIKETNNQKPCKIHRKQTPPKNNKKSKENLKENKTHNRELQKHRETHRKVRMRTNVCAVTSWSWVAQLLPNGNKHGTKAK